MKKIIHHLGAMERRLIILCTFLFIMGVVLVTRMPERIAAMENQRKSDSEWYQFADMFSEIYKIIRERYVTEVPAKQLFEGAINGMFATLDGHSSWLPPDDQESLTKDTEGEYSGIGLHIQIRDQILTVISPIPGSPAAEAGIAPWDRIIEIDGKTTKDVTLTEAVKKLTGPTGTSVKLKIWREGASAPMDFEVKRQTIKIVSVYHKVMGDNIGYLRLTKFQDDTAQSVQDALKDFKKQNVRGIIVDLRNNAGGLLDRAVEICDMFLPKNQLIVSIRGRNPSNNREYFAQEDPILSPNVPVLVLVNHGSASASEIFAGCMKDTKRGVIMGPKGQTTFGKGSVQTISPLKHSLEKDKNGNPRESGIRLTTALYYTPSGVSIHEKGIKPDVGVELPRGHELALLRHGLLGDPPMVKPKSNDGATTASSEVTPSAKPQDADTSQTIIIPDEVKNNPQPEAPADDLVDIIKAQDDNPSFHDILLDEALKYIKTFMISEGAQAA